jgi:hypothetical protein
METRPDDDDADDDQARVDRTCSSDRQDLPRPASRSFAATDTNDVRLAAAGNLAFLLSVIRCGEQLSPDEETAIRRTIDRLILSVALDTRRAQAADPPRPREADVPLPFESPF